MLRTLALLSVLAACGGDKSQPEPSAPPPADQPAADQPAADQPAPTPPPPETPAGSTPTAPEHATVIEILKTSTIKLAERTESDCSMFVETSQIETLGALVAKMLEDADTQETECKPAPSGHQCSTRIGSVQGEDEYMLMLEYELLDGAITPSSVRCRVAG